MPMYALIVTSLRIYHYVRVFCLIKIYIHTHAYTNAENA